MRNPGWADPQRHYVARRLLEYRRRALRTVGCRSTLEAAETAQRLLKLDEKLATPFIKAVVLGNKYEEMIASLGYHIVQQQDTHSVALMEPSDAGV